MLISESCSATVFAVLYVILCVFILVHWHSKRIAMIKCSRSRNQSESLLVPPIPPPPHPHPQPKTIKKKWIDKIITIIIMIMIMIITIIIIIVTTTATTTTIVIIAMTMTMTMTITITITIIIITKIMIIDYRSKIKKTLMATNISKRRVRLCSSLCVLRKLVQMIWNKVWSF